MRKILHVDMDAFYASVEQRDFPELKGKPIAVGGNKERGVVAAASYEARKFGVKSAMSSKLAAQRCPELIFVSPRFEVYQKVSKQIHAIFERYTDLIEPLALDEAYLDVTRNKKGIESATKIAMHIKSDIQKELHLIASAGVSINKFLAKVASDIDKPNGLYVIAPEDVPHFLPTLEVKRIPGVGKVMAEKMRKYGILFVKDLIRYTKHDLNRLFGSYGNGLFNLARGIDNREVKARGERKSIGIERTLDKNLMTNIQLSEYAHGLIDKLIERYVKKDRNAHTLTLKVKYGDFNQITRSKTLELPFTEKEIRVELPLLVNEIALNPNGIRLVGLSLSNFKIPVNKKEVQQLTLNF